MTLDITASSLQSVFARRLRVGRRVEAHVFYAICRREFSSASALNSANNSLLLVRELAAAASSSRPLEPGAPERLLQPPAPDRRVVAAEQHRRHRCGRRSTSGRVYCGQSSRPAVNESSTCESSSPEHARQQPRDRVDHDRRRELAAAQHIVAERELRAHLGLDESLVDSLVAARTPAASRAPPRARARTPDRTACPAPSARTRACPAAGAARSARTASRSGSYFSTIPGPPPYGRSSTVRCRSVANSRGLDVLERDQPALARAPDDAELHHGLDELREQRHDADAVHRVAL